MGKARRPPAGIQIEHVAPDSLVPAPYNPRSMTDEARARLERGIAEFGLVDPIIARREDSLVIGGHQRLTAARKLGLATVPVVYLDGVTDDRAAALNVLLNNPGAQGEWDMVRLSEMLSELDANGFDATVTGFDEGELERLLTWAPGDGAGTETDPVSVSTDGDQWICAVSCKDERELAALYEELSARGLQCRLIT